MKSLGVRQAKAHLSALVRAATAYVYDTQPLNRPLSNWRRRRSIPYESPSAGRNSSPRRLGSSCGFPSRSWEYFL